MLSTKKNGNSKNNSTVVTKDVALNAIGKINEFFENNSPVKAKEELYDELSIIIGSDWSASVGEEDRVDIMLFHKQLCSFICAVYDVLPMIREVQNGK